jgi:hypothetical protein
MSKTHFISINISLDQLDWYTMIEQSTKEDFDKLLICKGQRDTIYEHMITILSTTVHRVNLKILYTFLL